MAAPVWVVDLDDGRAGFGPSSGSGKAERLAHTARVTFQPCDARGRVRSGSPGAGATAELVTDARSDAIRQQVVATYGFQTTITTLLGTIGGTLTGTRIPYGDIGVVLTTT